jgi:transcription initiation factor IIE alpha subunit
MKKHMPLMTGLAPLNITGMTLEDDFLKLLGVVPTRATDEQLCRLLGCDWETLEPVIDLLEMDGIIEIGTSLFEPGVPVYTVR